MRTEGDHCRCLGWVIVNSLGCGVASFKLNYTVVECRDCTYESLELEVLPGTRSRLYVGRLDPLKGIKDSDRSLDCGTHKARLT